MPLARQARHLGHALAVLALTLSLGVHADPRADYDTELATVKALSAALARESAAEAKSALASVAARQKEAEELAALGEFGAAKQLLDEGYRTLQRTLAGLKAGTGYTGASGSAATSAGGTAGEAGRAAASYDTRLPSATALLDTLKRLDAQQGQQRVAQIGEIDSKLKLAAGQRATNPIAALTVLDDAYGQIKTTLAQMQAPSNLKSGSAALDATVPAKPAGDDLERHLQSARLLREAIARLGRDKNVEVGATLARLDQLLAEAQGKRSSDASVAARSAADANQMAKDALAKLR